MSSSSILVRACASLLLVASVDAANASSPDPLLAIDQNRVTVIDRIVDQWAAPLAQSSPALSPDQLRTMLSGLRADHLLAASLAGTLNGLRDVMASALVATSPDKVHAKAVGDTTRDLVYTPIVPCRILDTRNGTQSPYNAPLAGVVPLAVSADPFWFPIQGGSNNCAFPFEPAVPAAIAVVLTVVDPNFDAFLAASNSSDFPTLTQSVVMNFSANKGLSNTAIVPVDDMRKFYLGLPAQVTTNVLADLVGYSVCPDLTMSIPPSSPPLVEVLATP